MHTTWELHKFWSYTKGMGNFVAMHETHTSHLLALMYMGTMHPMYLGLDNWNLLWKLTVEIVTWKLSNTQLIFCMVVSYCMYLCSLFMMNCIILLYLMLKIWSFSCFCPNFNSWLKDGASPNKGCNKVNHKGFCWCHYSWNLKEILIIHTE